MDNQTYQSLLERIENLEIQLNSRNSKENKSIVLQLSNLHAELNSFYSSNNELITLNRIINDLKLWDKSKEVTELSSKVTDLGDTTSGRGRLDDLGEDITTEMKQKLILLKYPIIKESYNNLIQLSNTDIPKLVNYIASSQDKIHNFNQDKFKILQRETQISKLSEYYHILVVKNLILSEKYLNLVVRENKFWLSVSARLDALSEKIKKYEDNQKLYNKY